MKLKIYILIGLILTILVSGCIQQAPEAVPANEIITIDIPTSLAVGEKFEGRCYLNKSYNIQAYIVMEMTREGYDNGFRYVAFEDKSRSLAWVGLPACEITEKESHSSRNRSFKTPGTYIYEVAVYDCARIEEILRVDCLEVDSDDVITQVTPVITVKKIVTVTGEA